MIRFVKSWRICFLLPGRGVQRSQQKTVEAHLEECVRCRDLAKAMQTDFACMKEENDRRERDDQREIDALRRVKRRSRIRTAVIAVVVAVCMAFGAVAVYSLIGNGFSIRNRTARQERSGCFRSGGRMERSLRKSDGARKGLRGTLYPVVSFLDRSDDISYGGDGRQIPSKLEVAFPEGNSEQKYMVEDISLIQDLIDDGDGSIGGKIYREEGLDAMFTGLWLPARQRRWRTRPATTF